MVKKKENIHRAGPVPLVSSVSMDSYRSWAREDESPGIFDHKISQQCMDLNPVRLC